MFYSILIAFLKVVYGHLFAQLYDINYSRLIQIICTLLYGFKYFGNMFSVLK